MRLADVADGPLLDQLQGAAERIGGQTRYSYDWWDNLTKVIDANSQATQYDYDELGRLTRELQAGAAVGTEYLYAATLGPMLTKVRKPDFYDGEYYQWDETAYLYDQMRRLTKADRPTGETDLTFQYDVNSQLTRGRDDTYGMTVGSDTVDDWYFEYDGDGRTTKELLATSSATYPYVFALGQRNVEFDAAGRRTKLWFSSANRTGYLNLTTNQVYSYDSTKHRLTQIQRESDSGQKAQYSYDDSDGRVTKVVYGNAYVSGSGARAEYGHDASGALTKISHFSSSGTGGTLIASAAYSYDLAGNVTKAVLDDALTYNGDATLYYYYDDLHRLTREYCQPAQGSYRSRYDYSYTYDSVGNRQNKYEYNFTTEEWEQRQGCSYSSRNELTGMDEFWTESGDEYHREWSLYYDLRGNLTKKQATHYCINSEEQEVDLPFTDYYWDSRDLMTKVQYGYVDPYYGPSYGSAVQYKYDGMGRRVAKKVDSGSWKWYFYDGLKVIAEGTGKNAQGQDDRMFYTTGEDVIGGIICRDNNGTKYWYHTDRLGNVMAITDSNGAAYAVYTMDAWGNVLEKGLGNGYSSEHGTDPQPYHLTTKEYDPDSQLYYFNARWYDPTTGRFVSREPILQGVVGAVRLADIGYAGYGDLTYYELALGDPKRWDKYGFCLSSPSRYVDSDGGFPKLPFVTKDLSYDPIFPSTLPPYGYGRPGSANIGRFGPFKCIPKSAVRGVTGVTIVAAAAWPVIEWIKETDDALESHDERIKQSAVPEWVPHQEQVINGLCEGLSGSVLSTCLLGRGGGTLATRTDDR